jgi:mono/diheme cytochrome c family protein
MTTKTQTAKPSGWLAAAIAAVMTAGSGVANAAPFDAFTLADYSGAELFQRFCASCHGESARGDGPVARSLNTMVPDLTAITARYGEFPAMLVRETIDGRGVAVRAHGTRAMPVWGYEFWVEEGGDIVAQTAVRDAINKLVEYLGSIQRDDRRVPDADGRR